MVSDGKPARCRVGIDVGGTFTDFVLTNPQTGEIVRYKEPSVPSDPSLSVARGLPALIERAGVRPGDVELLVHGTTLLVNAIIQRRGARVGLVVSRGHRGVLEIGRMSLDNSFDFTLRKEEPLVPRNLVFETGARIRADGTVMERPSDADLDRLASDLDAAGVEAVTVLLLNSYAFPETEREVAEALRQRLPGVAVTESAEVWPEQREFERGLVAIMNAYVQPLMSVYLDRLEERVAETGVSAPIYITASNGGTLSIDTARERPIDTVLSGPASGLVAATRVARTLGRTGIITVDLGGTSCDLALNQGEEPEYATSTRVGDYPLVVPVVNVRAIGAGGGSVLWVDPQGVLKVGPQSAGADPGPACYGRGGVRPTITDCYLHVGLIHPEHFLGGRMRLDREAARESLDAIADRIGYEGADRAVRAADAALRVASAMMANELSKGLARRGAAPGEFALMAFGGAGPTHANLLAEEAGLDTVVVPPGPATFCALGAILADVKRDYVRSHRLRFADGPRGRGGARLDLSRTRGGRLVMDPQGRGDPRRGGIRSLARHALRGPGIRPPGPGPGGVAEGTRSRGGDGALPPRAREDLQLPGPREQRRGQHRAGADHRTHPAARAPANSRAGPGRARRHENGVRRRTLPRRARPCAPRARPRR